jgi:hypothetical protein
MERQKLIMIAALIGWGLFVGTQVTKTLILQDNVCTPKTEAVPVEVKP